MKNTLEMLKAGRSKARASAQHAITLGDKREKAGQSSMAHRAEFDLAIADMDAFDARITEVEGLIKTDDVAKEAVANSQGLARGDNGVDSFTDRGGPSGPSEAQLRSTLTGGGLLSLPIERRDLSTGVAAAGGDTVPTTMARQLVRHLVERSPILSVARVLTTDDGASLEVPISTAFSAAAATAELAAIGESDPTFAKISFGAFKYARLLQVSNELLADSAFDMSSFVAEDGAEAIASAIDPLFMTGTGTGQPTGVATAAGTGTTATATTAVTVDELIDLQHSVTAPYRSSRSSVFIMNDASMAKVRKLKDSNGQYLVEPNLQAGDAMMLLGHRVLVDPNMPAMATGNKAVLFGDMSKFWIRLAGGIRFEVSPHFAFDQDVVTYRVVVRVDSKMVDNTGAVKALVMA